VLGDRPGKLDSAEYISRQLLYGAISVFWLLPSIFGDQTQGRIRAFLRHPIPAFFGAISLSFYVYHVALLHEVEHWVGARPFENNIVKLVGIALPLTFGVAVASHFVIERPFLRLKDRSMRSLFTRDHAQAAT
jgi:peptidoglycan/LPS O-acetylase OafA/YrhL